MDNGDRAVDAGNGKHSELMMDGYVIGGKSCKKSFGGREYEIERYQGNHANEYCVYEVNCGVRDGTAELFDNGIVKMRWRMVNGARDGRYVLFDKGVVVKEGRWCDVGGSEERVIENRRSGSMLVIRVNGVVTYEGEFSESMERDGWGMEYEDGVLKRYGRWKNDELIEVKQEFLNEKEMIEFGKEFSRDLFSRRPVYVGGFVLDRMGGSVKRNGAGRVLSEETGVCVYESEWESGVEREEKRVVLCDGWYCERGSGESTRSVVSSCSSMVVDSSLVANSSSVTTNSNPSQPTILPSPLGSVTVEELTVEDNCFNELKTTELKLLNLPQLKRVVIGNDCFGNVRLIEMNGLNELVSVVIRKNSFSRCKEWNALWNNARRDGSCRILNCPKLISIQIGEWSLSDYHSFELHDLPSLQSIELGHWCFYYAPSFALIGLMIHEVDHADLPQLQSVALDEASFYTCHSIVFESKPRME